MSAAISDLKAFEPGVFIKINDVMTGVRKLVRVRQVMPVTGAQRPLVDSRAAKLLER